MLIQISSGHGPEECEFAVAKLTEELCRIGGTQLLQTVRGRRSGCYKSVILSGTDELARWVGSVQWICKSPFRPKHKRKNWFIDVCNYDQPQFEGFNENLVRFETFRSSGNGGQHVNKTESGVRAIYSPTGDAAISTDERSQYRNKQIALRRLSKILEDKWKDQKREAANKNWMRHERIERGNAIIIYEGEAFKRKG